MNDTEGSSRKRRQVSGSYMEVMVYIDQDVESGASNIGIDASDYILTIINIVRTVLQWESISIARYLYWIFLVDGQFVP